MTGISLRLRTGVVGVLVVALSLILMLRANRADNAGRLARQGAEVTTILASVAATLNFAVQETAALLDGLAPLVTSADTAACRRGLEDLRHAALGGSLRQVFIVRDGHPLCQSEPGPFSLLDEGGKPRRWAIAPSGGAPLASGEPILGEISREWVVVVARHLPRNNGMVVASLSLSTLNALVFRGAPQSMLITVIDQDGRTMLRSEDFPLRVGRLIPLQQEVAGVSQARFGLPFSLAPDGLLRVMQPEPVISPDAGGALRVWAGRELGPMPWVAFGGQPVTTVPISESFPVVARTSIPALLLLVVILWILVSLTNEVGKVRAYVAQVARDGNMLMPRRFAAEFMPLVDSFREAFDMRRAAELQLEQSNQLLSARVEERLAQVRRSDAFRDAVMETTSDALLVVDARGIIVSANSGVTPVLGFLPAQLLGKRLANTIVPPDFRQAHLTAFDLRIKDGAALSGRRVELPVLRADGHTFPAEITLSTTCIDGQFFAIGYVRDITERARAEAELRAATAAAQTAARVKSEFLTTMSHEIRTPLNGIMGMLDLLIDSPSSADRSTRLAVARQSADTLLQLLNDILDYSRLDAGKVDLDLVDFELRLLIAEVADLIGDAASRKGLAVHWQLAADVPQRCHADRSRLRQILFNLASNAVKFTAQGKVEVRAEMAGVTETSARIRFSVEDTGVGIAADRINDVFDPFTQADSSVTRRFGGTGLGLAIVKALTDRMGGAIAVTSEFGVGSTFTVDLDVALPQAASTSGDGCHRPVAVAKPGHVLIVEDDPTSQLVASEALSRAGHECDIAADGPSALRLAAASSYDLVLMDIVLPGANGYDVARSLRRTGFCGPIIAVTAHTSPDDELACLNAGMNAVLAKPVWPTRLVEAVSAWLPDSGVMP